MKIDSGENTMVRPPSEWKQWQDSAEKAVDFIKKLGNTDRLKLLCRLSEGECHVGQLETECGIRQPTLSQQLGVLRRGGLIVARKEGKQIFYRLADGPAMDVMAILHRHFCGEK